MKWIAHLFAVLAVAALPAAAQVDGIAQAQLRVGGQMDDGRLLGAVQITLNPDWKTYWRSPGEGGLPPHFNWTGSENLADVGIIWPRPQVFTSAGITNIGYHDDLVLPIAITPVDASQPVQVQLHMTLGVCKDICIPADLTFSAQVGPNMPPDPVIQTALAQQPVTLSAQDLAGISCTAAPIKDGMTLTAKIILPPDGTGPETVAPETVVIEHSAAGMWLSSAQLTREGDLLTAVADIVPPSAKPFDINGRDLRITVIRPQTAFEIIGCPVE
ncbi:MAG: protein-disulfide reductase DsbD family protein [Cypionkella sp.]|nr:protein-disulfide reductase DsbD family protein [Cypionkella sp.]